MFNSLGGNDFYGRVNQAGKNLIVVYLQMVPKKKNVSTHLTSEKNSAQSHKNHFRILPLDHGPIKILILYVVHHKIWGIRKSFDDKWFRIVLRDLTWRVKFVSWHGASTDTTNVESLQMFIFNNPLNGGFFDIGSPNIDLKLVNWLDSLKQCFLKFVPWHTI